MNNHRHITNLLVAVSLVVMPAMMFGQDFDDIYYSPKKTEKKQTKKKTTVNNYVPTPDYPAADTYSQPSYTLTPVTDAELDAYNRRGVFAEADTANAVSVPLDSLSEFEYTRRIERYHNPDVVTDTNDPDLIDYYYNQSQPSQVTNIYINGYNDWAYSPYYYNYGWRYGYPYYRYSWYDPYWSWSWSWGWDPYWYGPSWSWGWGYPGYYPPYRPSYHPWNRPGWSTAWRPSSPGSSRPHPSVSAGSGRRPGSISGTTRWGNTNRPGNMGRPSTGNSSRPGNYGNGYSRPGQSGATSRPSGSRYNPDNHQQSGSSSRGSGYNSSRGSSSSGRGASTGRGSSSSWGSGSRGGYSGGSHGAGYSGGRGGGSSRGRR